MQAAKHVSGKPINVSSPNYELCNKQPFFETPETDKIKEFIFQTIRLWELLFKQMLSNIFFHN